MPVMFLESELQEIAARHGLGEVRGRGLLLALDLKLPIGASISDRGAGRRRAHQLAAARCAPLHAGAQRHTRGDIADDRLPGRDFGQGECGETGSVKPAVITGRAKREPKICTIPGVPVLTHHPGMTAETTIAASRPMMEWFRSSMDRASRCGCEGSRFEGSSPRGTANLPRLFLRNTGGVTTTVIARSVATKQSIYPRTERGLLRFDRNDGSESYGRKSQPPSSP